jgi:hypothetical protein
MKGMSCSQVGKLGSTVEKVEKGFHVNFGSFIHALASQI